MKNVKFNDECRDKLVEGVKLITDAVATTFGPNANNVCIKTPGRVNVTKDGATVCNSVSDQDPYVQMGIDLVKEASIKTAKDVGDGSTTVCLLTRGIVTEFLNDPHPTVLSRNLKKEVEYIVKDLEKYKVQISTDNIEELKKVATLSANGDEEIGQLIAEAFNRVGKHGIVQFEATEDVKDSVEYSQGFRIDSGYVSSAFRNTPKGTCELKDVYVHISDIKMSNVKELAEIADKVVKNKQSLLVIAPGFDSELLVFLRSNLDLLKSCAVVSPNFRNYREILTQDIKMLLGESSSCKKVIINQNNTTFIGYNSNTEQINKTIKELEDIVNENSLCELDMDFHKKRLANFTSGIATIYVGSNSRVETSERYDRFEDAIRATDAAIKDGILPGGGVALLRATYNNNYILNNILKIPFNLLKNTFESQDIDISQNSDFWYGVDWKTGKKGNMYEMGIVEPFSVVKTALETAVSTGSIILTCKCSILDNNGYE